MPANFRMSGKKYKSRNGLVKYQDTGEYSELDYLKSDTLSDAYKQSVETNQDQSWIKMMLDAQRNKQNQLINWMKERIKNPMFGGVRTIPTDTLKVKKRGGSCRGGCSTGPNGML